MAPEVLTFRHALECAGWGRDPDEARGAAVQQIVRGKQVGPTLYWNERSSILDSPTGYDYAKKEEYRVFAWDENFFYLQENDWKGTGFIQVPKPPAYASEPIVVVDWTREI